MSEMLTLSQGAREIIRTAPYDPIRAPVPQLVESLPVVVFSKSAYVGTYHANGIVVKEDKTVQINFRHVCLMSQPNQNFKFVSRSQAEPE